VPCNYADYHPDWKSIRRQILDQADHLCEFCGVGNGALVMRPGKVSVVVLTIAHLCHDTACYDPTHLRALCQKCHLSYDAKHHQKNAAQTRRNKKVMAGQLVASL